MPRGNGERVKRSGPIYDIDDTQLEKTLKKRKRILIIDDDELVVDSLTILLKKHHYHIETALNGFEALELLDEETFDLVMADIKMPGINGVETVRALRETGRLAGNREIPVVFMTGYTDHDLEKQAKKSKYLAFLYKPFDDTQILQILKKQLGA
ncbi:response regulator [Omnitrophica bacterium]|nr:response regulator [Candidatus Omnitrophota bacterium]